MDKKKLLIIGGIVLGVIVLVIVGVLLFKKPKVEEEPPKEEEKKPLDIRYYELQTHEYFENSPEETKYMINSVDELNIFYYLFSDVLNIKEKELLDCTMFVEVRQVGSGSIKYKVLDVNVSGKINFLIKEDEPEIGTEDMAFWYLVAFIPNDRLVDVDTREWILPSVAMNKQAALKDYTFKIDNENKFELVTDQIFLTTRNDGGSYDSIYYQIDLENNVVIKRNEVYNAPEGNKTNTIVFAKKIDSKLSSDLKTAIINLANSRDSGENENYAYYTLSTLNFEKKFYDAANINKAKQIIDKIER